MGRRIGNINVCLNISGEKTIKKYLTETVKIYNYRLQDYKDKKNFDIILNKINEYLENDFYDWNNEKIETFTNLVILTDMLFIRGRERSYYLNNDVAFKKSPYYMEIYKVIKNYYYSHYLLKESDTKVELMYVDDSLIGKKYICNSNANICIIKCNKNNFKPIAEAIKIFNDKSNTAPLYSLWEAAVKDEGKNYNLTMENPYCNNNFTHAFIFAHQDLYIDSLDKYILFGYDDEAPQHFKDNYKFISFEDMLLDLFNEFDKDELSSKIIDIMDFYSFEYSYDNSEIPASSIQFFDRNSKESLSVIKKDFNKSLEYFNNPINMKPMMKEPKDKAKREFFGTFESTINACEPLINGCKAIEYKEKKPFFVAINNVLKLANIMYGSEDNLFMQKELEYYNKLPIFGGKQPANTIVSQLMKTLIEDIYSITVEGNIEVGYNPQERIYVLFNEKKIPLVIYNLISFNGLKPKEKEQEYAENKKHLLQLRKDYPLAVIYSFIIDDYAEENVDDKVYIRCFTDYLKGVINNFDNYSRTTKLLNKFVGKLKFK